VTTAANTAAPFRILTVCTGNICRSPLAERLLQHGLDQLAPGAYRVDSAGTGALVGAAMEPHIEGFVRVLGASADNFSARQLTAAILAEQDLVLALTRRHRSRIMELHPGMLKKAFTLRELARLLPQVQTHRGAAPRERWEAVIPLALRARSLHGHNPEEDDVVDPYGRGDDVYEQTRREIMPAVLALLQWERANA
jgi:protein-tyrosine phosphatase